MTKKIPVLLPILMNLAANAQAGLKVHEWGTFTSVQGSNGIPLTGLEREEEALPSFVHNRGAGSSGLIGSLRRCGCSQCCKGMCCGDLVDTAGSGAPLRVTQKMETPVLYFYSPQATQADVQVDFPKGLISQYYPKPTAFEPPVSRQQTIAGGQIRYSGLQVLTESAQFPTVDAGNAYGPARETAANAVRVGTETEKFIFYRGLGDFTASLQVTSTEKDLTLRDLQNLGTPYVVALQVQGGKGAFKELGSLPARGSKTLSMAPLLKELTPTLAMDAFMASVGKSLEGALVRSGLYQDEARAMVNTWKVSYFQTEGLRLLYVLPRAETDTLLPIRITPQPEELVRTLVGRVEVFTQAEEAALLTTAVLGDDPLNAAASRLGRFRQPKLRRIRELTTDPVVRERIDFELEF